MNTLHLSSAMRRPRWLQIWAVAAALAIGIGALLGGPTPAYAAVGITAATGGGAISADTAVDGATPGFTALTGPVITEDTVGGILLGTIVLTAPAGFVFNTTGDQVIVTPTPHPGFTCAAGDGINIGGGTSTPMTFTATATTITVTVGTRSTAADRCDLVFSGVQVQPTAGTPGVTGPLTFSGTSNIAGFAGTLTVAGPVPTKVSVETAADGSGTVVGTQTVAIGASVTGYAISRSAADTFVANVAATWSVTSKTGGVADGDLIPAGDAKSAVFTGALSGSGVIHAESGALTPGNSGTLTVPIVVVVPIAGPIVPAIVPVPAHTVPVQPPSAIIVPPVPIAAGGTPVEVPPVLVPEGVDEVIVPIIGWVGGEYVIITQTVPTPAATGNAGLAGVSTNAATRTQLLLLALGATGLIVGGRWFVSHRSQR